MKRKVSKTGKPADTEIKEKKCTNCGKNKPLDEFGNLKAAKDGKMSICKECNRARSTAFRKLAESTVKSDKSKTPPPIKVVKKVKKPYDWSIAPIFTHEVRKGNDCVIGDYFKNNARNENFILKIVVWDINEKGNRYTVSTHRLFVTIDEWKKMMGFTHFDVMQHDLFNTNENTWKPFVDKYAKKFNEEKPDSLIGLRFKKHGSNGMQINCGFNIKAIPALEEKFAGGK